jgi:hypothetical protein
VAILGLCLSACMHGSALMPESKSSGLIAVLHASGPASDRAEALALYGQFIGDWDADIVSYAAVGTTAGAKFILAGFLKAARSRTCG